MPTLSRVHCLLTLLSLMIVRQVSVIADSAARAPEVVMAITREVVKQNTDPGGWPLPVVSHWASGFGRPNFSSEYQIGLLEQGHHILPTLPFPRPGTAQYLKQAKPWVEKLAHWEAPFSLRDGQWESVLYDKKHPIDAPGKWRNLPTDKSPLAIDSDGHLTTWLSPWGAIEPWYEAGVYNTSSGAFRQLEQWYPHPPLVILLSNNEARRLKTKHDIESRCKRFVDAHGRGNSPAVIRRAIADGYQPRYAALLRGIRDGLTNEVWQRHSLRVGYGAFGPPHFGRWEDWTTYSLATDERIEPWHLVWDGGSPSYYTHNWNDSTDYRVHSPQVESNNWVFMLDEAYRERPNFWFEMSVWDGNGSRSSKSKTQRKMDFYQARGQEWSSARYAGFVQYGLWLLRPRVVREFRGSTVPRAEFGQDFEALAAAVDRVWTDPVLTRFWRHGKLVPNRAHSHPYQVDIPVKWKDVDRWFMLDTSVDPPRPWNLLTELPVFSLARVLGEGKKREWLVYAHAPVASRRDVHIQVPEFGSIRANVTPGGCFFLVKALDGSAARLRNSNK